MRGIMSDAPLSLTHVFHRAERLFGAKQIVTATAAGRERTTYADMGRAHPPARRRARDARARRRRARRHVRLEHRAPPGALLRGAVQRARAATR